ncbi:MAG: hypothetical protein PHI90_11130 [Clostridia bacterium]|nr:hypothetical protein [Clostridia bacterium]
MRKIILIMLMMLTSTSLCFAEKQEWVEKTYDFSKITKVTILDPIIADNIKNGIKEREISEIFKTHAKLSNIKLVEPSTVILSLNAEFGVNLMELNKINPHEARKIIDENSYKYTDLLIKSEVLVYDMGKTYSDGVTFNTTQNQTSQITNNRGMVVGTVQTPVSQTHTIGGGNVDTAYNVVRFIVTDVKTGKDVFLRIDNRTKVNVTKFDNTKPKDIYGRIVKSFFNDLSDKFGK